MTSHHDHEDAQPMLSQAVPTAANAGDRPKPGLDLESLRAKLAGKRGPTYWRALEEVAETEEFQTWMEDEFPNRRSLLEMDRRSLLKFMGASVALAGLSGCRGVFLPEDKIVPYVKAPEEVVPGRPLFYASSVMLAGYATGVLVQQNMGRPTKLEGNPEHPASLGAIDAISQAEILNLYDPDRAQNVLDAGDISSWEAFGTAIGNELAARPTGRGVALLMGQTSSPTLIRLVEAFRAKYPEAGVHTYEPVSRASVIAGTRQVAGADAEPVYDLSRAEVILTLDGDFLSPAANPGSLRYAREFSEKRRVMGATGTMNRLYAVESHTGLVGAMADHRYPVKASSVYPIALEVARRLGVTGLPSGGGVEGRLSSDIDAIIKDLQANRGASAVFAGSHHGPELHAVVAAINAQLGNVGTTVRFIPPVVTRYQPIEPLVDALNRGAVGTLIMIGGNPAYDAPAALKFGEAMQKAKVTVYHGISTNETAELAKWNLPGAHALEAWGDGRSFDGTLTLCQPIVAPLFAGRSEIEVLSGLLGASTSGYEILRATHSDWSEAQWRDNVHAGFVANTASAPIAGGNAALTLPEPTSPGAGMEVVFLPDPYLFDGRFANNGWLMELPRPLSKMTWDNVVTMSPRDAQELGLTTDDLVKIKLNGAEVEGGVYLQPGQPLGSVTIHLGFGHTTGGSIAAIPADRRKDEGGGFDAYVLRPRGENVATGVEFEKIGWTHLAGTQGHSPLGGDRIPDSREVIKEATLAEFIQRGNRAFSEDPAHDPEEFSEEIRSMNLFPEEIYETNLEQWGMTIDMNTCIGCNACVAACQAENNISVVGKEQVGRGREMHWLRIDRYYKGDDENPELTWQPVACVHCEKAPCEPVCPVAATVHSHEGLNQMVYNRCVGTRYCSNNCPYKVRRFNYLNYSDNQPMFSEKTQPWNTRLIPGPIHEDKATGRAMLKMINNPRVTVRGRGVMEKCTYCVQRINDARIEAKKAGREMKDGDVVTACAQACPTRTITFGNVADPQSRVTASRKDPRSYLLLEELQTRPRTSHMAKLRNPNPEIQSRTETAMSQETHEVVA